jgi:hypothetical protein
MQLKRRVKENVAKSARVCYDLVSTLTLGDTNPVPIESTQDPGGHVTCSVISRAWRDRATEHHAALSGAQ